jgi:hypothetical protein
VEICLSSVEKNHVPVELRLLVRRERRVPTKTNQPTIRLSTNPYEKYDQQVRESGRRGKGLFEIAKEIPEPRQPVVICKGKRFLKFLK